MILKVLNNPNCSPVRVEGLALTRAVLTDASPFSLVLERKYGLAYVLGLVGMELTFFIAGCMVLCLGFWAKTVLMVLAVAEQ